MGAVRDLPWYAAPVGMFVDVRLMPRGGHDTNEGIVAKTES
jgi:hypothetical protein